MRGADHTRLTLLLGLGAVDLAERYDLDDESDLMELVEQLDEDHGPTRWTAQSPDPCRMASVPAAAHRAGRAAADDPGMPPAVTVGVVPCMRW